MQRKDTTSVSKLSGASYSSSSVEVDADWHGMFKAGSVAFTFLGALFILALAGVAMLGTIPSASVGAALTYINAHSFYYELTYGSQLASGFLLFPSVFSVFLVLRYASRTWASIGFGTMAVGIPIYILGVAQALVTFSLAGSYSIANDQSQTAAILGAGLSNLTSVSLLAKMTYLVFGIGSLVNSVLFAKSPYFGKVVAALVLSGSFFGFIGIVFTIALAPSIILFVAAFIVTGLKLGAIPKRSVPL
jgi:hypothetical protein